MPRRGKAKNASYGMPRGNLYALKPIPSGIPRPMCLCGDPCKVEILEDEDTFRQRYWMCPNYQWEPTPKQRRSTLCTVPPICDFEEWMDKEIKQSDKEHLQGMKEWDAERREMYERRMKEEAAEKEHKEEEARRRDAAYREEVEKKRERGRRAKAAMEENPDALRKGKWSRCTQ